MTDIAFLAPIENDLTHVETRIQELGEGDFPWLGDLLGYVLGKGGKRLRPAITLLVGHSFHYHEERHIPMAAAVELLHLATLVHDDTVDDADLRRGQKTTNALWGTKVAVLLGDYLFANSAELVTSTGSLRATELFAHTLRDLATGELQELYAAFKWKEGRDYYWQRIVRKTASLFATAAQSAAILGDASEEGIAALREFGTNVGTAFQVVDDILDFDGIEEEVGKPVGNDLLQGVLTLPAILFLERYASDNPFERNGGAAKDPEVATKLVEKVRDSRAIPEAYKVAEEFSQKARDALQVLPDTIYRRSLLEIVDYTAARRL